MARMTDVVVCDATDARISEDAPGTARSARTQSARAGAFPCSNSAVPAIEPSNERIASFDVHTMQPAAIASSNVLSMPPRGVQPTATSAHAYCEGMS